MIFTIDFTDNSGNRITQKIEPSSEVVGITIPAQDAPSTGGFPIPELQINVNSDAIIIDYKVGGKFERLTMYEYTELLAEVVTDSQNQLDELTATAERNGWDYLALMNLFEYKHDELNGAGEKCVRGIIEKAITDGDDPEWIEEMVEENPN